MKHIKKFEGLSQNDQRAFLSKKSNEIDEDLILLKMKKRGWGDIHSQLDTFQSTKYYSGTTDEDEFVDEFDFWMSGIQSGDIKEPEHKFESLNEGLSEEDKESICSAIDNEGFGYAFMDYSNFEEIEDEKFHQLRKAFKDAGKALEDYVGWADY